MIDLRQSNCICNSCSNVVSTGLLILRTIVGGIFLWHASMKFGASPETVQFVGSAAFRIGLTFFTVETWFEIAKYGEIIGGLLLIFGWGTKFASNILMIIMILAANAKGRDINTAELDIVLLAILIAINFTGPGKWSLAAALCKHSIENRASSMACACCIDPNCECGDCMNCQPKGM